MRSTTGQDGRNDGAESALGVLIMASALQNLKSSLKMLKNLSSCECQRSNSTGVGVVDFLVRSMFRDPMFQVLDVP